MAGLQQPWAAHRLINCHDLRTRRQTHGLGEGHEKEAVIGKAHHFGFDHRSVVRADGADRTHRQAQAACLKHQTRYARQSPAHPLTGACARKGGELTKEPRPVGRLGQSGWQGFA